MGTINLRDIKNLRLERHWSQDQLAEMSGLSVRTIQRIENGENAGLESLKALAAVFEMDIVDSDKKDEIEQAKREEAYVQRIKGFYKLLLIAIFCLVYPLFDAIRSGKWTTFSWVLFAWVVIIGLQSLNVFEFFGAEWEQKLINKKFKK